MLEQTVIEAARTSLGRFAIEGLDDFARRLGPKHALGLFSRLCPQLFDLGSIAYWRAPAKSLSTSFLESVRKVTQCVLQIRGGQLRVLKAEGHRVRADRRLLRIALDEAGTLRLRPSGHSVASRQASANFESSAAFRRPNSPNSPAYHRARSLRPSRAAEVCRLEYRRGPR